MNRVDFCGALQFAAAFELYWPYSAYCCALSWAYLRALWRKEPGAAATSSFSDEVANLFAIALWKMAFKVLWVWLIGGSILLAIGVWACERSGT